MEDGWRWLQPLRCWFFAWWNGGLLVCCLYHIGLVGLIWHSAEDLYTCTYLHTNRTHSYRIENNCLFLIFNHHLSSVKTQSKTWFFLGGVDFKQQHSLNFFAVVFALIIQIFELNSSFLEKLYLWKTKMAPNLWLISRC